ncbi:MAG: YfcE family phosphodiesterase [Clostridia bacterium]|nr:YfcE family phosphodiesterase [Clostridia bacterium]
MKIIVYSDSHGCRHKIRNMLEREKDADYCFFLGDGITEACDEAEKYPHIKHIMVKGNCDYYSQQSTVAYKYIDGLTFVACHGHEFNVKRWLTDLTEHTRSVRGNIALYGHTHIQNTYNDGASGIFHLNPGSLATGQYSVITTDKGKFDIEHRTV